MEGDDPRNTIKPATFKGTPVVYLDMGSRPPGRHVIAIKHDAKAIVRTAMQEFSAIGCTSCAYVGWHSRVHWSEDKRKALSELMKLHGRTLLEFAPHGYSEVDYSIGLSDFVSSLPAGCGILAANDIVAIQVMNTARKLGRDIPDDLAVIGVDNSAICQSVDPTLSSFALDFNAVGEVTMRAIENFTNAEHGTRYIPPLQFMRRRSTMRIPVRQLDVVRALDRIRREALTPISSQDILSEFECSRRMAEMKFRSVVGHSILQEIKNVRMEKVCELLRTADITLSALADRCGFRSPILLERQFKARFGCTPHQWRSKLCTSDSAVSLTPTDAGAQGL